MSLVSADASQRPIALRIRGVLNKIVGRKTVATSWEQFNGPHWRESVNDLLPDAKVSKGCPSRPENNSLDKNCSISPLLALPKELRHLIEDYLHRADVLCLRQTCHTFRHESKVPVEVQDLNARQLYSFRKRLDLECFPVLCSLEDDGELNDQLAACSFCLNLHDRKDFKSHQLKLPPQQRVCNPVLKNYLICGEYWTNPAVLRSALDAVLATGRDGFRIHHRMPRQTPNPLDENTHIVLSRAIEHNTRLSERRSSIFVEDAGLALEHHFHLQALSRMQPLSWNFVAALSTPRTLPICPHLTIHAAGVRLGIRDELANRYAESCHDAECRTSFGWFECSGDSPGREDLCFRVLRRFGWLENVTDSFWRSQ